MKEIKTFFTKDNRLNKGYSKISNIRELDSSFYRKKFEHILPPIDLISEYENINPGTLAKLIDMAEQEQHHKHAIDLVNLENYNRAQKMGRIFALIFIGLICLTTICLTIFGKILIALVFSCSAFLAIGITSVISANKAIVRRDHRGPKPIHKSS
jgi:uncharacterized membrane protein